MSSLNRIDGNSEALKQLRAELEPVHRDFNRLDAKTLNRGHRLPRLAVVGAASCGKSSVLDAFAHIGFPVSERHGTPFTTAVILRCTAVDKSEAKVNNGDSLTAPNGSRLQTLKRSGTDERDFRGIVDDAKSLLGVRPEDGYCPQHGLYIKVSGPDLLPMFITDLPGVIWEDEARGDGDAVLCRELAEREMANRDVVILAVVSAQGGPDALRILDVVKKFDPRGERTLGIITKPDLAVSQAEQLRFTDLVRNQDPVYRLDLGWHMLRNRPHSGWHASAQERDWVETEFFRTAPWSAVPPQARGAWMLRLRLGHILQASILKGLPDLTMATDAKTETLDIRLQQLGPPLSTIEEARACMVKVAARYQTLLMAALKGDFTDTFFGDGAAGYGVYRYEDTVVRRLRVLMSNLNKAFALVMVNSGAKRHFINANGTADYQAEIPEFLKPYVKFYHQPKPMSVMREEFIEREVEGMSRGNSSETVITALFREQAEPWQSIATTHVELAKSSVRAFVESTMTHIVGTDNKLLGEVLRTFVDPFFVRTSMELELKLKEMRKDYYEGHPQPHDADFRRYLFQQHARLQYRPGAQHPDKAWSISRTNAEAAFDEMGGYYNYHLQNFTENVITLVVNNCLLANLHEIITLDRVLELTDEDVQLFVTETEEMKQRRTDLKIERFELVKALSACQKHLDRGFSGAPLALRSSAGSDEVKGYASPSSTNTLSSF